MTYLLVSFLLYAVLVEWLRSRERASWAKERQNLLQRIQAPEAVIHESFEPSSLKQFATLDDDESYWSATKDLNGDG